MTEAHRCPRCDAALVVEGVSSSLSRTTRDDGALIKVCSRCGEREALYGYNPLDQVPFTEWPVDIDRLVEEERCLIEQNRKADLKLMTINPEIAKEMLDEGE